MKPKKKFVKAKKSAAKAIAKTPIARKLVKKNPQEHIFVQVAVYTIFIAALVFFFIARQYYGAV